MSLTLPTDTVRVRPDIFIKCADDRLYLRHGEHHYLLRLTADRIDWTLRFLDGNDGHRPVGQVLTQFPMGQHAALLKFLDFLIEKGAAFVLRGGPIPPELNPVSDTLVYLNEYVSDPVSRYEQFSARRLLVVGGGYALSSLLKTLARLGAQRLAVVNLSISGHCQISDAELARGFDEVKSWPDAQINFIPPDTPLDLQRFDEILHCHERIDPEQCRSWAERTGVPQRYGFVTADALYITDDHGQALTLSRDASEAELSVPSALALRGLIGGAELGLACFDWLTGIKPHPPNHYQHFNLVEQGARKLSLHCHLRSLTELVCEDCSSLGPGVEATRMTTADWDDLAYAPLFPLQRMKEETDPQSYIKLYTLATRPPHTDLLPQGPLAAAGFDKSMCQRQIALTLIARCGLWFTGSHARERIECADAAKRFALARTVVDKVRPSSTTAMPPIQNLQLSGREQYIAFCIGTSFGATVHWQELDTGHSEFPHCVIACANDIPVFLLHESGPSSHDREQLLFGLYAALWARRTGSGYTVTDVFLPDTSPTLARAEAA